MKLFVIAFFSVVVAFGVIEASKGGSQKIPVNYSSVQRVTILKIVFDKGCKQDKPDLVSGVLKALGSLLEGLLSSGQCNKQSSGLIPKILGLVDKLQKLLLSNGSLSGCGSLLEQVSKLLSQLLYSLGGSGGESSGSQSSNVLNLLANIVIAIFDLNNASKSSNQGLVESILQTILGLLKSLLGTSEGSKCGGIIQQLLETVDGVLDSLLGGGSSSVLGGVIDDVGYLLEGLLGTDKCSSCNSEVLGGLLGGVGNLLDNILGIL